MGAGADLPGVMTEVEEAAQRACLTLEGAPPATRREKALEDALEAALDARLGSGSWSGVQDQFSLKDPAWPGVGPVDLALDLEGAAPVLIELKWDDLPACAWDMSKLALAVANEHASCGILAAVAPTEHWDTNPGSELFTPRGWRADLLLDRFGSHFAYWATDVKTRPRQLPTDWECSERFEVPLVLDGEEHHLRALMIKYANPDLVDVEYRPVALLLADPYETDPIAVEPKPEPVEPVEGNPEQALKARAEDAGSAAPRTVAQGEGGAFVALDLPGLEAREMDEDEQPTSSRRWFRSPGERRLYLEQRGLRLPTSQQPDVFQIGTGSGMGASTSLNWNGLHLVVTRQGMYTGTTETLVVPDEAQWARLWRTLDKLDVWSWAPNYQPLIGVTDGHGWEVDIAFIGRSCRSRGYHAYPDGADDGSPVWNAFELALEDLIGMPMYDLSNRDLP